MAPPREKKSGQFYAWSTIHNGGESELVNRPNGLSVKVVTKRNIIEPGDKVSEGDFEEADWEGWVASGAVRPYPLPEGTDEYTSPHTAVLRQLVGPDGEIDVNKLIELQNTEAIVTVPPATNPSAEDAKELPAGA
jgi:hypothetical protein